MRRLKTTALCLIGIAIFGFSARSLAQQETINKKQLKLPVQAAKEFESHFHLLPTEEEQEPGNAIPVLLRMVYEQQTFMRDIYPKLHEYVEMDVADPRFNEFYFARFAEQINRAGSMSFADWQYPIRRNRPYTIMLPDMRLNRASALL